jgi:hypothetical protein
VSEQNQWPERLWRDLEQAKTNHLSYSQLAGYVDSSLDPTEAELVRAHTDLCALCAEELADLLHFATGLREKELPKPARLGLGERFGLWIRIPRHALGLAGVAALLAVILVIPHGAPKEIEQAAHAPAAEKRPIEAVLETPTVPSGFAPGPIQDTGRRYRVLTKEEREAYQKELAAAPEDPVARGAIALKYSLFDEAEKQYRKIENTEEGRGLLRRLNELRGAKENTP